ncbi:hypothetical protein A3C09_01670 [Candidatus Uhrbacteria bacterium RIFCSPHIGHO2_02_FULL_47_44]|uniref:Dihydrolipoyl dehydrogenase n=1 Tax=Candidatus Uhrbacteria bacterium RIFCSPLOWO2_02_FULL_48_18 TaxID=1802408 RepID=A0A1F7V8G8_9BACT|nr:MAG: hypothetical protein A3C09_01670 [Candidatus Uhrbacteria bacterium RIFCSPHIGHO2_02_FULL_47_44]OGL75914.1 MAG: hypothetical protein A3E97_03715 [Candidatus Uhrbacteria bacterium RIFCSPHIGHO2_12_FULL_47_12]OGL82205.1 MAG: hypothetical protein A3B20_00410 [Candidatus Uhrbacteria bacterium RIFCSPLOWO2_01_FULL_47_17]OGL86695.1 MAG: hypothetical protein A3I41_05175 [Candidatus Uhrbacteria bacterium RIFCSPLOWO2_02_FULL_48_18]OGL94084.1 MAG: hypothetical protein A3H12_01895 [Candidatus Uhrbacte
MSKHSYDVLIIGSGSAGFSAAEAAASLGARVCMIEKGKLGGECPNLACIPSKALLAAARAFRNVQETKTFGVACGAVAFDFEHIMRYRDRVVEKLTGGGVHGDRYEQLLKEMKVDVVYGNAVFEDDHNVLVAGDRFEAKAIVIATGSTDFIPDIPGLDQIHFWHWYDALSKKRQPKALAIIGGGPVACEIATFYATLGTRIVLIQRSARLLTREDEECARFAEDRLRAMGVEIVMNAVVSNIVDGRGGVYGVHVDVQGTKTMHAVEQVVVATGKRARLSGLEEAHVSVDPRGSIMITNEQQTNKKHLFAAGDVCGSGLMLTSTSHHEGFVAGYNAALFALNKRTPKMKQDERVVPRITFVEPEFASVGAVAGSIKEKHGSVLVGRAEIQNLGRAFADHAPNGIVKLAAHPKTRKVLGGAIIGPHAGEIIHEVALAIYANLTVDKLAEMIHAFPTYSEAVTNAASNLTLE